MAMRTERRGRRLRMQRFDANIVSMVMGDVWVNRVGESRIGRGRHAPFLHVVAEVVVAAGEIREKRVKVARLLHTITNAGQLVREVLATRLGGIKITLNRHADCKNTKVVTCVSNGSSLGQSKGSGWQ
jgi:hypothetical protein